MWATPVMGGRSGCWAAQAATNSGTNRAMGFFKACSPPGSIQDDGLGGLRQAPEGLNPSGIPFIYMQRWDNMNRKWIRRVGPLISIYGFGCLAWAAGGDLDQ